MRRRQRGITIVTLAILMPVILIVLGLAIDLGVAYVARTSAQAAADAGALAGAMSYRLEATPDPTQAAVLVTNQNKILTQPIAITAADVSFPTSGNCASPNHCVTVTIPLSSPTYFAKMFGWTSISMTVNATAQSDGSAATGAYCAKPIFVPNDLIFPPTGSGPQVPLGTLLQDIRPTNPTGALAPSNYYSLDYASYAEGMYGTPATFTDGTSSSAPGGSTYRMAWGKCAATRFQCGYYPIQTGNMIGPTQQGVQDAGYTAAFNPTNLDPGSLVTAPVWDTSVTVGTCPASPSFPGALKCVNVIGFAELFMNPYNQTPCTGNGICAYFVNYIPCGAGGSGSGGGAFADPLRLVKTP